MPDRSALALGILPGMLLIILLIVLAIASGALGVIIKGAFWLFILTALFLIGAFFAGRVGRSSRT